MEPPRVTALPVIALTMGDPAGIGFEITAAAWRDLRETGPIFFLIGDPAGLRRTDPGLEVRIISNPGEAAAHFSRSLPVLPLQLPHEATPGTPDPRNAGPVIGAIEQAVAFAMAGAANAIVTNPIAKSVLYQAGFAHPGHTEFLAALTGVNHPVPVTVHGALRRALDNLNTESIVTAGQITVAALIRDFGVAAPRLAVAGLNPHAGEAGAMGDEETLIIIPAIEKLRNAGIDASGPWPPDTMFTETARRTYDAALCMYHDQALIPLKTLNMKQGVNVTLGLPIIRASPDHGTAFDIAGKGIASPASLIAALRMADAMVLAQRNSHASA
jgi:4-hydroxythreonine-4-phosphate dehydrogenase